jgi:hypothetical protein
MLASFSFLDVVATFASRVLAPPLVGPHVQLLAAVRGAATDQEGTVILLHRWLRETGQEALFAAWLAKEASASMVHVEGVLDWILSLCVRSTRNSLASHLCWTGCGGSRHGLGLTPAPCCRRYKAVLPLLFAAFVAALLSSRGDNSHVDVRRRDRDEMGAKQAAPVLQQHKTRLQIEARARPRPAG